MPKKKHAFNSDLLENPFQSFVSDALHQNIALKPALCDVRKSTATSYRSVTAAMARCFHSGL